MPVTARIGDAPPVAALLEGGIETPLSLFEASTRRLLWSAADHPGALQTFADMDAAFFGSIAAIDLDADGLHDRIYAGDIAGRLWRFDVHHGAAAADWTTGGVLADFTNTDGRGFIAAPDVSLSSPPGAAPWLNIAIGTAAPGNASASNRFYVLRDHAGLDSWTDEDYEAWKPVQEKDLVLVNATVQSAADVANFIDPSSPGWYIELGSGHVVAPSITVNHRVVLSIAASIPRGGSCEVLTRIASLEIGQGRVVPAASAPGSWTSLLPRPLLLSERFSLGSPQGTVARCTLGGQRIAACDVDTRPRKTWWRREDAE
ncbi:MAG TPA: hypothetical protein VNQ32_04015 [Steroidobacteraceae bacterium]|nr:hypothetical protein [Steroidobacteraceae bacterium]